MKTLRGKEINKEKWQMENGLAESVDTRKEKRVEDNRGKRYKMEDDGEKWWKQNPLSRVSFILPAEINVWIQSPHTRYVSPVVSCFSCGLPAAVRPHENGADSSLLVKQPSAVIANWIWSLLCAQIWGTKRKLPSRTLGSRCLKVKQSADWPDGRTSAWHRIIITT